MRAHPTRFHALIVGGLLSTSLAFADDTPPPSKSVAPKPAVGDPTLPPLPKAEVATVAPTPPLIPIVAATPAEVSREKLATEATLDDKEKPLSKPIHDLLAARLVLLEEWRKTNADRLTFEKPARTPEAEGAELRAELEKTRALLDQSASSPDALLPEVFRGSDQESDPKKVDVRLAEMKEAIDSARLEVKEQSTLLESLRAEGSRKLAAEITAWRLERDKVFQGVAGLTAQRGERQASLAAVATGEARDLAKERLVNLDWQARLEVEKLAAVEAKIALATRRIDLGSLQIQAKALRVQLGKRLAERMEARYNALAERQRNVLKQAVAKEETRAANSNDPLERRRAQRTAQLLDLESQVVAY